MGEEADRFINILDPLIEKFLNFIPISWADNLALLHPYVVIFAVSLPLVAIGLFASKKEDLSKAGKLLSYFGIFFIFLAFLSGKSAYIDARANISYEGLEVLNSHANAGMLLFLSYLTILILTLINLAVKKDALKNIITFMMYLAGLIILYLMTSGINLVFHHGAGLIL